jgi:three-Cys-motif partner protein
MRKCGDNCRDQDGNCPVPGTDSLPVQCVGPWVLDKYCFLERYVDATRAARKKFSENNNAVFLDLFAGSGRCVVKNEDREVDNGGLRVINYQKVPFNEYYFIDISPANEVAFRKRVATRQGCYFRCGDSNSTIEDLVNTFVLKDYRYHFTYIDPFGPDGLKFSTIESLAKLKRIDLLINFPIGSIKRNIPKWLEGDSTILDEFLGTKNGGKELKVRAMVEFWTLC